MEEEAREYVSSVHIEDDATDNYSLPEQQQDEEPESEEVDEEIPAEEIPASFQTDVSPVQPPLAPAVEEPVEEPQRKTYASIVSTASTLFLWHVLCVLFVCDLRSFLLHVSSIASNH